MISKLEKRASMSSMVGTATQAMGGATGAAGKSAPGSTTNPSVSPTTDSPNPFGLLTPATMPVGKNPKPAARVASAPTAAARNSRTPNPNVLKKVLPAPKSARISPAMGGRGLPAFTKPFVRPGQTKVGQVKMAAPKNGPGRSAFGKFFSGMSPNKHPRAYAAYKTTKDMLPDISGTLNSVGGLGPVGNYVAGKAHNYAKRTSPNYADASNWASKQYKRNVPRLWDKRGVKSARDSARALDAKRSKAWKKDPTSFRKAIKHPWALPIAQAAGSVAFPAGAAAAGGRALRAASKGTGTAFRGAMGGLGSTIGAARTGGVSAAARAAGEAVGAGARSAGRGAMSMAQSARKTPILGRNAVQTVPQALGATAGRTFGGSFIRGARKVLNNKGPTAKAGLRLEDSGKKGAKAAAELKAAARQLQTKGAPLPSPAGDYAKKVTDYAKTVGDEAGRKANESVWARTFRAGSPKLQDAAASKVSRRVQHDVLKAARNQRVDIPDRPEGILRSVYRTVFKNGKTTPEKYQGLEKFKPKASVRQPPKGSDDFVAGLGQRQGRPSQPQVRVPSPNTAQAVVPVQSAKAAKRAAKVEAKAAKRAAKVEAKAANSNKANVTSDAAAATRPSLAGRAAKWGAGVAGSAVGTAALLKGGEMGAAYFTKNPAAAGQQRTAVGQPAAKSKTEVRRPITRKKPLGPEGFNRRLATGRGDAL